MTVTVTPLVQADFSIEAARERNDSNVDPKFGRNAGIGSTLEDIWTGGGIWVPPTTARIHDIVSTDVNDDTDGGGTNAGARTVDIGGLDTNGNLQSETVTLDGTGNVATVNAYTIIHRMIVATAGTSDRNEGTITATAQTDGTVTAQIEFNASLPTNQTEMAIYRIPTGFLGLCVAFFYQINAGSPAADFTVCLVAQNPGGVYTVKHIAIHDSSVHVQHVFHSPKTFVAGTTLKLQALASSGTTTDISAGFCIINTPI